MKTYLKIIALLCLLCLVLTASAQCPSGDVTLLTQAEVNEFGTLYPNCTELAGNLEINTNFGGTADITDLSPVSYTHLTLPTTPYV